jgi:hypothetical protein
MRAAKAGGVEHGFFSKRGCAAGPCQSMMRWSSEPSPPGLHLRLAEVTTYVPTVAAAPGDEWLT